VAERTTPHLKACRLLKELEEHLSEHAKEIPAGDMALFHIRRTMELIMCSPEEPTMGEVEKKFRARGVIVE
jgi:hypothetical protein